MLTPCQALNQRNLNRRETERERRERRERDRRERRVREERERRGQRDQEREKNKPAVTWSKEREGEGKQSVRRCDGTPNTFCEGRACARS